MKRIFLLISLIANALLISAQVSVEAEIDSTAHTDDYTWC